MVFKKTTRHGLEFELMPILWLLLPDCCLVSFKTHFGYTYYSNHTKVLQAIACQVCSKVQGIGDVERN